MSIIKFYAKIRSIGNGGSYSVPIPKEIFDTLGLKPKEMMEIYMDGEKIVIQREQKKPKKPTNLTGDLLKIHIKNGKPIIQKEEKKENE